MGDVRVGAREINEVIVVSPKHVLQLSDTDGITAIDKLFDTPFELSVLYQLQRYAGFKSLIPVARALERLDRRAVLLIDVDGLTIDGLD